MIQVRQLFRCLLVGLGLLAAGCGSGLVSVTGEVNHEGKPLESGTITFHPEKGRPAYGKIVNGKIVEVTTLKPNDGLAEGTYKVQIEAKSANESMYAAPKSLIPSRYADPEKSDLKAEIKAGMQPLLFDLK